MAVTASPLCWILAGPESGRKDAFISDLAAQWAARDGSQPERHRLYSGETGPDELLNLLQNGSLFASRKVVEYRNAEALTGKAALAGLESYLTSPSPEAILILVTESYSLAKSLETAVGAAGKKIFWELRESEKPAWIRERLSRDRISADEDAIEAILELVENETSALDSACLMLGAYFPEGTRLGANEVEACLSRSRREDAFSLFDRMAEGEFQTALEVLDTLLSDRQTDPAQIIAALTWSFRKLERLRLLADSGYSPDDAMKEEKITSKTAQRKFRIAMQRYSAGDCLRIVRGASETEALLRGGAPAAFIRPLLHLLVRSIMVKKGQGLVLSGWKEREYYLSD